MSKKSKLPGMTYEAANNLRHDRRRRRLLAQRSVRTTHAKKIVTDLK